jgi:hypothetical protein
MLLPISTTRCSSIHDGSLGSLNSGRAQIEWAETLIWSRLLRLQPFALVGRRKDLSNGSICTNGYETLDDSEVKRSGCYSWESFTAY